MDSTLVAVFENPHRADDAKRDVLARGMLSDKDVSVVRQRSALLRKGPLQRLKGMLGSVPPLCERAILTVYAGADSMRQLERIIREHEPADVQTHLAASTGQSAHNDL